MSSRSLYVHRQIVDPAFCTSPGPVSFIHEVIMLPAKEPQAPDEVFMLLEEARISQNVGHYEVCIGCIMVFYAYSAGLYLHIPFVP
jgi:hypothetical protein